MLWRLLIYVLAFIAVCACEGTDPGQDIKDAGTDSGIHDNTDEGDGTGTPSKGESNEDETEDDDLDVIGRENESAAEESDDGDDIESDISSESDQDSESESDNRSPSESADDSESEDDGESSSEEESDVATDTGGIDTMVGSDTSDDSGSDINADTDNQGGNATDTGIDTGNDTGSQAQDTDTGGENYRDDDVCQFTDDVTLEAANSDGMVFVPPDHPDILYFGRVDCSNSAAPAFAFPGVSVRMRFSGDAVDMMLKDYGNSAQPNFYNIIIDDQEPFVVEVSPNEEVYSLVQDLSDGEHTVEVFKRVESNSNGGKGEFLGFRISDGGTVLPLAPRPHRIEFIGNSITCGYGNEISTNDPNSYSYTTENSNAYMAWGAMAARTLDAEYMAVAYSGRGMTRNYAGGSGETMPQMYLDTLPDDASAASWDVGVWTPDVVVINLGTNDFSTAVSDLDGLRAQYRQDYIAFLETLRGYYEETVFILVVGPMLGDTEADHVEADLATIIDNRSQAGDNDIHLLVLPQQTSPYGEDWHPTVATHQDMADRLVALIDSLDVM